MTTRRLFAAAALACAVLASAPARLAAAPAADPATAPAPKAPVVMYATAWCPYCAKARAYMNARGIPFTEHDIEKSAAAKAEFRRIGGRGVPVLLVGEQRMNGYSEARFAEMLKRAGY